MLPPARIVTAAAGLAAFESDGLTTFRARPRAVVLPETGDEVIALVRLCAEAGVPFVARGSGTSLSAYAAIEKQVSRSFVVGAKLDIDRADYYEPTVFMIYLRHAFAPWTTRIAVPPRPLQPYNEK